ncbi:MAG TPA: Flp pilus assembly protein CpaB [Bryobacteraceae bacterium]|nr:Flp pilus assembly protein CpaB [Bryobacteraceae bacterium]
MNKRFLGVLIFAFIVAALGGLVTYRQLINHAPKTAAQPTEKIVTAAHDLQTGQLLTADDLKLTDWAGPVPEGSTAKPEDLVGRGVITPIFAKEPVTESRLAAKGAGGGLAALIPDGMRAFAVRVNEVAGVAGFVTPGQRVDVVINGNAPDADASQGSQARTLLQDVTVLSAGQDYKKDAEGKPIVSQVVNLLVSPEDAEKLILAANQTSVQLVLRNPLDRKEVKTPGVALASLFHGASAPAPAKVAAAPAAAPPAPAPPAVAPPPAQPPQFVMEIIAGGQKTEHTFAASGGSR